MTKSATDVMQEVIFSAVLDAIGALKAASQGLPNTLLRELNAVHANTTLADLPKELQASINASVRAAFTRLLKEGYSISNGPPAPVRAPDIPRDRPRQDQRRPTGPHRRPDARPPRNPSRPGGGPRPKGPRKPS